MEIEEFFESYNVQLEDVKKQLLRQHSHVLVQGSAGSGKTTLLKARSAYLIECEQMEAEAKQSAEAYWQEVSKRLQSFYETHQELKKLLHFSAQI